MFYRIALLRCSELETEIGKIYSELAASPAATPEKAAEWTARSREELMRARVLRATAELAAALEEDGPFLVHVPLELRDIARNLDVARRRLMHATDAESVMSCVEALESAQHAEMYAGLLEIAEAELRRVLKMIDCELKTVRRRGASARSGDARKARWLCA